MSDFGADPALTPSGAKPVSRLGASRFDPGEGRIKRLLVCGGRDFDGRDALFSELDRIAPTTIIQGGARGADRLAANWANAHANLETYPADWDRHGKAAGAIRNQQMLDEGRPDAVLACPGGRGTADMVRRARSAGLTIIHLRQSNGEPQS
jgi:hypothetical protein